MPNLMDLQTWLNWWTDGHADFMDWHACLICWTDGFAWFNGLMDMPDLIDWRIYYPCCRYFCRCCSGRCVIVVAAAIDYNVICILWLMDFFLSLTFNMFLWAAQCYPSLLIQSKTYSHYLNVSISVSILLYNINYIDIWWTFLELYHWEYESNSSSSYNSLLSSFTICQTLLLRCKDASKKENTACKT